MSEGVNPYAAPSLSEAGSSHLAVETSHDGFSVQRIDFETILDDVVEFNVHHIVHSTYGRVHVRRGRLTIGVYAGVVVLWTLLAWLTGSAPTSWTIGLCVVVVAAVPAYPLVLGWKMRREVPRAYGDRPNRGVLGARRVTILPEGLRVVGPYIETLVQWPAIEDVLAGPDGCYLYTSPSNAHLVPRRAFGTDTEFDAFVALARKYQEAARTI